GRAFVIERIVGDRSEGRLESGQPFERGLRPWILLAVERETAVLAIYRHETLVEMTALDRYRSAFLAFEAQLIDVLSRDAFERCHSPEIATLRTALRTGTPDDVVDIGGIDASAIGQRAQYGRAELLRMNACQRALAGLADPARCPACVDDQRVNHGVSFMGLF